MREYNSKGIICVKDNANLTYALCEIEYVLREDDTYKFTYRPNYSVIDMAKSDFFQGIPGINLDLRKQEYVRENIMPVFISERVPQGNREDYFELLNEVDMDFMDPIEYLIRTKKRYFGDNLFVKKWEEKKTVLIDFQKKGKTNEALLKELLTNICLGNDIIISNDEINDSNRKTFYDIFLMLFIRSRDYKAKMQKEGILEAKENKKYRGRKPIEVSEARFLELENDVRRGLIKPKEAALELGISIDKYYRVKKKIHSKDSCFLSF